MSTDHHAVQFTPSNHLTCHSAFMLSPCRVVVRQMISKLAVNQCHAARKQVFSSMS